jgi:hypothetical protein
MQSLIGFDMNDHSQDEGDLDGGQCCRSRRSLRFAYRWSLVRDRRDESQLYQQDHVEEFRMRLGGDFYLVRESFRIRMVTARKWLRSSMLYKIMNPFRTGKLVLFQVSYDRDWHYFEIPFYILIGVFGVSSFRAISW